MAGPAAASGVTSDPALVRLRLLGDFRLTIDGDERAATLPARAPALLGYLILHAGQAQPRQRIAALLWPESTDGQARTNLRNVLHHLRRTAPPVADRLEIGPSTLRWLGGPRCQVDLTEFLSAVAAAGAAPAGSAEQRDALRAAVRHVDGDLLADCPDEWLAADRARLREQHLLALRQLVALLSAGGPAAEAIEHGRDLVRRDPLNEEHHRLLIAAHQAAGDRAGAVRAYHDCVTVLRRELNVAPSAATRDAYRRLVAATSDRTALADRDRPVSTATRLVGRTRELAELARRWRDAGSGGPALVLVAGEAGVGKTRLVEELALRCGRAGALVVSARCYASEGELGYGAIIEWLRSPELAPVIRRILPADRRYLARLMPELAPGTGPADLGDGRTGEMDQLLLFDAIVRALTGSGRPVLLVLDDAHWCDEPSLRLVHYLVRSAHDRPVLVVATARREEIDDRHPLAAIRQDLLVLDRAAEIGLERLSSADTAALARSLIPQDIDESAAHRLYDQTEGNPLFVVEAVRAGWTGDGPLGLTPKLQSVIAGRLRRLSAPARELVEVAATIGRAFTADLLGRAAGYDELAVVRGLDELWRRGVIASQGIDSYDFSHGRIRDVAYDSMSPVVRQRWHLAVATTLAASPAIDIEAVSGQVAAHFDRAGRAAEAIDWYERATAQAIRRSAHAEAYALLSRAMVLARGLPEAVSASVELRLLAMTPPALGGVDGYSSDRLAGYERRAHELAARLGAEVPAPLLRSSVMDSLCRDEFDRAAEGARRLLAVAEQSGDRGLAIESHYLLGIVAFWSGDVSTAATRFRQVVDEVDEQERATHLVRFGQDPQVVCLSRLANAQFFLGDSAAARSTVDDALALAERVGDLHTRDIAHIFAVLLAIDLGDPALAARAVELFRDGRHRSGPTLYKTGALLGYADVLAGRAAAGIERIEWAIRDCGPRNPAPGFIPTLHRVLVGAYHIAGDTTGGLAAADRALALGGTRLWEPQLRRLREDFAAAGRGTPSPVVGRPAPATPRKRSTNAAPGRLPA